MSPPLLINTFDKVLFNAPSPIHIKLESSELSVKVHIPVLLHRKYPYHSTPSDKLARPDIKPELVEVEIDAKSEE